MLNRDRQSDGSIFAKAKQAGAVAVTFVAFVVIGSTTMYAQDRSPNEGQKNKADPAESPGVRLRFSVNLPIAGPKKRQIRTSTTNGVRTITVTEGDEQIEMTDTNGKKITFKHTRPVKGTPETSTVEAADLCRCLPALPDLARHAAKAPAAASTQPVRLSFSCASLVGQICTEQITAAELAERLGVAQGIALCIHNVAVRADSALSQVRRGDSEKSGIFPFLQYGHPICRLLNVDISVHPCRRYYSS